MSFTPRPYQLDAIEALLKAWADGKKRVAVVLPTGAGKTIVFFLGIAVPRGASAGDVADLIDQDRVGRVLGQLILPAAA